MQNLIRNRSTTEHYAWGQNCDAWYLLKVPGLTVIEEQMPPLAEEVLHRHSTSLQLFFILKGNATVTFEGGDLQIPAGQAIEIVPGSAHKMKNTSSSETLEFLVISHPPSHGDREDLE